MRHRRRRRTRRRPSNWVSSDVGRIAVNTNSPEETRIVGSALAPMLVPGDVVSLTGDLGAGKTVFVQGLAAGLGVQKRVTSPSFVLIREYRGRFPLIHLDLYRLNSFQEVLDLGFEELIDSHSVLLVEWGEAVAPLLPARYLEISIRRDPEFENGDGRVVEFIPRGDDWVRKLDGMRVTADTLLDAASPHTSKGSRFYVPRPPGSRDDRGGNKDTG
jgi:tRNA threonylcarbamoyladenosine biosynthesis protein TsaE